MKAKTYKVTNQYNFRVGTILTGEVTKSERFPGVERLLVDTANGVKVRGFFSEKMSNLSELQS